MKISGIRIDSGILRAVAPTDVRGRESVGVSLLNAFIAVAGKLCIFCGKPLTSGDWEIRQGRIGGCQRCIKKFGLARPEQDTQNHEEQNKYLNGDFDSWS